MNLTYDEILYELKVFSRNYSQAHLTFSKWRSYKKKVEKIPDSQLTTYEIDDKTYGLIYREHLGSIEAFLFETMTKRTNIKRSERFFKEIQCIWKLLNPFHLSGISRQVYVKFYEFVHFQVLNINAQVEEYENIGKIDSEIDFGNNEALGFMQFYDSIFENLDAYAKSTLVNEYCRIAKKLHREVKNSIWIKSQDLHNKLYCEGYKAHMPSWAVNHMKTKSIEVPTTNFIRSNIFTPNVPIRLMSKSSKKDRSNDYIETKYRKLTTAWTNRSRNFNKTLAPIKSPESKYRKTLNINTLTNKSDNVSPVAKKVKNFRDKKVIEEIVKDRRVKTFETPQRILQTPLKYLFSLNE